MSFTKEFEAANLVSGYYLPTPFESSSGQLEKSFERARDECLLHITKRADSVKSLTYATFKRIMCRDPSSSTESPVFWDTKSKSGLISDMLIYRYLISIALWKGITTLTLQTGLFESSVRLSYSGKINMWVDVIYPDNIAARDAFLPIYNRWSCEEDQEENEESLILPDEFDSHKFVAPQVLFKEAERQDIKLDAMYSACNTHSIKNYLLRERKLISPKVFPVPG